MSLRGPSGAGLSASVLPSYRRPGAGRGPGRWNEQGGWTYILTNKPFGVLYIGVTSDLISRMTAHRAGLGSSFCRRFNLTRLVFTGRHDSIAEAIARETTLKDWMRTWKLRLISETNPEWRYLADDWIA